MILLAAHGSAGSAAANEPIHRLARALRAGVAFHRGEPPFATALDALAPEGPVTVVPLMTSAGWYSQVVLPGELRRNRSWRPDRVRITEPLGTWSGVADLVAAGIRRRCLPPSETAVLVVGHGTPRHAGSRKATERLAEDLAGRGLAARVAFALLDEEPSPGEVLAGMAAPRVVVVPFLIGEGLHATRDLPRGLVVEPPVGSLPGLADLVLGGVP